jgi:hypothetical protein
MGTIVRLKPYGAPRREATAPTPGRPPPSSLGFHVRDSKNPGGPNLIVAGEAWAAFLFYR